MAGFHICLLHHTEVRWLSCDKILLCLLELHTEVLTFFIDQQSDLQSWITDAQWLAKLAYFADIFAQINEVNIALQRKCMIMFTTNDKIHAFKRKLQF